VTEYSIYIRRCAVFLTEIIRGSLQSCWIGYYLDEAQNGHDYATEAVRLIVNYAFDNLRLHRVEAGVMPHNVDSVRVLERVGFENEGLSKKNVRINGVWANHFHLAIVNPRTGELTAKQGVMGDDSDNGCL